MTGFSPEAKLFPRCAGVLLHPTSLPGPYGIGDLGAGARAFIDWMAEAQMSVWQMLPLVPPGAAESPYASPSAMAGNPWLIDPQALVDDGLLTAEEAQAPPFLRRDKVDFDVVKRWKQPLVEQAADRLARNTAHPLHREFREWLGANPWAMDAALFLSLRAHLDHQAWWQWPDDLRTRQPDALAKARKDLAPEVDRTLALQFLFDHQLGRLRRYAHAKGIRLFGDVPIYVDGDSADTWASPHLFQMGANGRPDHVAGVPPDYFSETGQLWGNPLYDWDAMAKDGYRWWIQRLKRVLAQTDLVRIDHFRGFSAYWSIPADAEDARAGKWLPGPGLPLFQALRAALGDLPLVAEDLGVVDDDLVQLREAAGLPGMLVLQFAWGEDAMNPFLPHNHLTHRVVYTGTHDNDTVLGWWQGSSEKARDHVRRYYGIDGHDISWSMVRSALASVAHTAIVPLQDLLGLDSQARMNTPGVAEGNWTWRFTIDALTPERAARLAGLANLYDRIPALHEAKLEADRLAADRTKNPL